MNSDDEKYFAGQPVSIDFFEIDLTGSAKIASQIKDWHSPKSIEIDKRLNNRDPSMPYNVEAGVTLTASVKNLFLQISQKNWLRLQELQLRNNRIYR